MTIRAIDAIPIAIHETTERELGYGKISIRRNVIVRIEAEDGTVGVSEVSPISIRWGCEETQESVTSAILDYMAPLLIGKDPTRISLLMDVLHRQVGDLPYACSGICDALFDLSARLVGVPVSGLLGGKRRDAIPASWSIAFKSESDMAREAAEAVSRGFQWVKIKIGKNPVQDCRNVAAIREAVGADFPIHVDANAQYSYLDALDVLLKLEVYRPKLIEQPVAGWNIAAMRDLRRKLKTPVMADESCRSYHDLQNLIKMEAADAIMLKLNKHGGILESRKIVDLAESNGMMMYPSIHYGTSIGVATSAQFYATAPNITPGSFSQGASLLASDLVDATLVAHNGALKVSDLPGIGVEIVKEKLDSVRAD